MFHLRDIYTENRFTQIYKALYGEAMFVSLWGHKYGRQKPTEDLSLSFPTNACTHRVRNSSRLKSYSFWDKECLHSKISEHG